MNEDKELEILRKLARHYVENGYSKAVSALKEIDNLKGSSDPKRENVIPGFLREVVIVLLGFLALFVTAYFYN